MIRLLKVVMVIAPTLFALGCDDGTSGQASSDDSEVSAGDAFGGGDRASQADGEPIEPRGPCLEVVQGFVVGGVVVGTSESRALPVWNCGDEPLTLKEIALVGDDGEPGGSSVGAFSIAFGGGAATIQPGDFLEVDVTFAPQALSPLDVNGVRLPFTRYLRLVPADTVTQLVKLTGYGVEEQCAIPVISGLPRRSEPGQKLRLESHRSFGPSAISAYSWDVEGPEGHKALFLPTGAVPSPFFTPTVEGTYRFTLTVEDALGHPSCAPAAATVDVGFSGGLEVVLTWETPGDPYPLDTGKGASADLDLHLAHPMATPAESPWFHSFYDCFWYNASPNWGSFDPKVSDDPELLQDGQQGTLRERLVLTAPEEGEVYRIGVHGWDDAGFGASKATVRVYAYGQLTYEGSARVQRDQMWNVGIVAWPSGIVRPASNAAGGADVEFIDNPIFPNSGQ